MSPQAVQQQPSVPLGLFFLLGVWGAVASRLFQRFRLTRCADLHSLSLARAAARYLCSGASDGPDTQLLTPLPPRTVVAGAVQLQGKLSGCALPALAYRAREPRVRIAA